MSAESPPPRKLEDHETCFCGSGLSRYGLYDARGIYCGQVCEKCEASTRRKYRSAIFEDSNYDCDEPIEPEE